MRYALAFLLAALALTLGAVATYRRLSDAGVSDSLAATSADTLELPTVVTPLYPTAEDYARFAVEDQAWRVRNARPYSVAELRARGDGRRSPRERMQDSVFQLTRAGERAAAAAVLRRWVDAHPRDEGALLSLARLLNELGRTDQSIARYRQLLALRGGGGS